MCVCVCVCVYEQVCGVYVKVCLSVSFSGSVAPRPTVFVSADPQRECDTVLVCHLLFEVARVLT